MGTAETEPVVVRLPVGDPGDWVEQEKEAEAEREKVDCVGVLDGGERVAVTLTLGLAVTLAVGGDGEKETVSVQDSELVRVGRLGVALAVALKVPGDGVRDALALPVGDGDPLREPRVRVHVREKVPVPVGWVNERVPLAEAVDERESVGL